MNWHKHNAWPVEAIRLLARAKKLRESIHGAVKAKAEETPEIVELEKELAEVRRKIVEISDRLLEAKNKCHEDHKPAMARIQKEVEKLTEQAKELKQSVPDNVNDFIADITNGVNYSSGFQIVWWNKRFCILRLPGRKFWSGIGMPWSYAKAETKLYDLDKFVEARKTKACRSSLDTERHCTVKKVEGKLSAKQLKEWKDESDYAAA
jgi:hypothetical protein